VHGRGGASVTASSSASAAAAAQAAANDRHVSAFLASLAADGSAGTAGFSDGTGSGSGGSGHPPPSGGTVSRAGSVYSLVGAGGRYEPAAPPLSPLAAGGSDNDDSRDGDSGRRFDDVYAPSFSPRRDDDDGGAAGSVTGASPSHVTLRRRRTGHTTSGR
jgi:hypothetical protein